MKPVARVTQEQENASPKATYNFTLKEQNPSVQCTDWPVVQLTCDG